LSQKLSVCQQEHGQGNSKTSFVTNGDTFLTTFVDTYKKHPEIKDSLLVALMHAFMSKLDGERNPEFASIAMNFYISIESLSRKTFDMMAANFLGPCLRTVQRHNQSSRTGAITECGMDTIRERLLHHINIIKADRDDNIPDEEAVVAISIGFDGTKVPQHLQVDHAHKAIVGGVYPNHFIDISAKTEEEVKKLLDPDSSIVKAKEVKVAVVSFQYPGRRHSPYYVLGARPQGLNAASDFNEKVTNVCLDVAKESGYKTRLVAVAADGVSVEEKWIMSNLVLFLDGKVNFVSLVDTNHNCKNFRYQFLGYSCCLIMGSHMVNCNLLSLAGISEDIWRVKDWASDLVVLRMASLKTITAIAALVGTQDEGTVSVMCVSLYFLRLKLFSVNCKTLGYRERIVFSWCSMIWITSFASKSRLGTNQNNTRINARNMVTETLAMIFAVARDDVGGPRFLTTESNEHTFAGWRFSKREATVLEVNQIEERRSNRTNAIFESGLQVSRRHGDGYNSSFSSFVDGARSLSNASEVSTGPVGLTFGDADDSAVDQLWTAVGPIINSVVGRMKALLNRYGVKSEDMSPFLKHFNSPSDLLEVYLTLVPRGVEGGSASDDTTDIDEVEAVSAESAPVTSEDGNLDSLAEAIRLVMGDTSSTTNGESNEEDDTTEEPSEPEKPNDDADVFAEDAASLAIVGTKFFKMLNCTTMQELTDASVEGMRLLHLKGNDRGSTSDLQKFKSLQGRWFGSRERKEQDGGVNDDGNTARIIEPEVHVKLEVSQGKGRFLMTEIKDFVITSVSTKTYNRWYLCDKGRQTWKEGMKEGKFRVEARMISFDHGLGKYEYVNPIGSEWEAKSIFVLADASDIKEVGGKISFAMIE